MSGRSKVVSDKTEFLNFQRDKCPISGAISRLVVIVFFWKYLLKFAGNSQIFRRKTTCSYLFVVQLYIIAKRAVIAHGTTGFLFSPLTIRDLITSYCLYTFFKVGDC